VAGGLILLHAADPAPWSAEGFAAALASLPAFMHDEIMALRRWQDRQARVLARLLLRTGLTRLGLAREASLRDWTRDPAGRPRLPGCPADFSLSHTSGLAVCALSLEGRVGVDVERLALTDLAELRLAFGPGEWAAIQAAPDPSLALLRLWTAKEAALKADGRGLSIEPAEIDGRGQVVAVRQAFWHISTPDLAPGWVCALASATRAPALDIVEAQAADLAPPG
jgi:4'-phosphopantetheinyl transferase